MAESDGGEKTEPATEKRREEFREKGDIARSRDVLSVLVLFSAVGYFWIFGDRLWRGVASFARHFLVVDRPDFGQGGLHHMLSDSMIEIGWMLAPLVLAIVVLSVLGSVAQTGLLFSTKPLEPDLNKLNVFTRFISTFFNKQALGNLVGSLAKISVVGTVVYLTVATDSHRIHALSTLPLGLGIEFLIDRCLAVLVNVSLVLIVIAIADYAWNKYVMEEKMKMTKQEVKDEAKQYEGNPHMKGQQRRRAMEIVQGKLAQAVPQADVVVNNPTHFSVALRYRQGVDTAPIVLAKGADHMAMHIRRLARAHDILMVENVPLARGLYRSVKVGRPVPSDFYRAVAEVLAYVYRLRNEQGTDQPNGGGAGRAPGSVARRPVEDVVDTGSAGRRRS